MKLFSAFISLFGITFGLDSLRIEPLQHASLILRTDSVVVAVDPVENSGYPDLLGAPDLILITHGHPDHFDPAFIEKIRGQTTEVVLPADLAPNVKGSRVFLNTTRDKVSGIDLQGFPMYNITEGRLNYHPMGNGNGYVLRMAGKKIYVSGDTEAIPELKSLDSVDVAFLCMNLPYTMSVEQAVGAVQMFQPKVVYPYHYRGTNGFSSTSTFKKEVEKKFGTRVVLKKWYPKQKK